MQLIERNMREQHNASAVLARIQSQLSPLQLMAAISNIIGIEASTSDGRRDLPFLEFLPWLALVALLAFTLQMWLHAREDADHALQIDFDYRVRKAIDNVSKRMRTYEQVMRGVDGLFVSAGLVGRKEFHSYISQLRLKEDFPGIEGIRFLPLVQDAIKDRHIAAIRREGLPSYTIWPNGRRDTYAPVTYSEPIDKEDQQAIGYDMLSDNEYPIPGDSGKGIRRTTMERARDSGSIATSGNLRLLYRTEQERQSTFVMVLPVYRAGASHATLAERRANIIGWVCSVFNADGLMDGILGEHNSEIDIEIYDGDAVSERSKMFDPQPSVLHEAPRFSTTQHLKIADRTWTVTVHSLPGFEERLDVEKPRIIAATGILISLFLALLFWMLVRGRKRALQMAAQLGLESHKNEMLLRTASDGIHILDLKGNLVQANDAFCRMLGYTHEEIQGMNIMQWDAQFSPAELKANIASMGSVNPPFETRHRCRDGSIIDVEINASLVEIDGQPLMYNSARNITERKRAEAEIFAVQSKLKATLEAIPDLLFEIGLDGTYHNYHSSHPELLVAPAEAFIGKTVHEVLPPEAAEVVMLAVREAFENESSFGRQIELTFPQGILWFELSVARKASLVEPEPHFIVLARDISERKRSEQQLRKLTAHLQSVREDEKTNIAREIHDDLGALLTAMKIESYWLKAELSAMKATALFEHVHELSKMIDHASGVMRDVITGLRPTVLDDLGLLAALEWQAANFQRLTGIKSRVNCIGDKGDLDKMRSIELFRISQEALSNVAKHSGASWVEIEYHHSNEEVVMSIIDNGRGIAETPADTTQHYGILGMRERTEQLGGEISIDTPPGGGFSLTVTLPLLANSMEEK